MKRELADFKITPKIVQTNVETTITIAPRGNHAKFDDSKSYLIRFVPMEQAIDPLPDENFEHVTVTPKDGALKITHSFCGEQMHLIRVICDDKSLFNFPIYSLLPDLYAKRPYKGDLHVHTNYSDGCEEPAVVVANYRKAGFDFLAITDHWKWQPSKEAIEKYKDIPTDINLFYGEEVHVQGGYIHAINFGGQSVNEYFEANKEKCLVEAAELAKGLNTPEGVLAQDYANRYWIAQKIREFGGLAIFVHPHWMCNAYNIPDKMSEYIFKNKTYDAFEVLGGQSVQENNMQTSMYYEQRANGCVIPIVGSSDSHGTEYGHWFQWSSTIVFAEDAKLETLKNSIKNLYSVAVESYPNEEKRVHGPYRMAKYGRFLLEEYFPLYTELCFEQGRAMKDCVLSEPGAMEILSLIKGRTDKFANEFFGR